MTKLEELKAAYDFACDAYDAGAAYTAAVAYIAELNKEKSK